MNKLLIVSGALACAISANAQQINSRIDLTTMLTSSVTDDFETFSIDDGNAVVTDAPSVAWDTVVNGQGPNLVNFGAIYSDTDNQTIQWNGNGYYGISSRSIIANSGVLGISFAPGINAFGLDAKSFEGYGYAGTMSIYNNATLLGVVDFSVDAAAGSSTFLGWFSSTGITHALLDDLDHSFSPIIDDHTYGVSNAVPEPASMLALSAGALALLRRRRSAK